MIALVLSASQGCKRVPTYVIQPDEMSELLADIHIGEGVVEQNPGEYRNDSIKRLLKQSIYERHGVTAEQVDTSMMWYGKELKIYQGIYDKTIEILEERLAEAQASETGAVMALAGDSVDVWNLGRHLSLHSGSPTEFLTFSLLKDDNWEPGDTYSWRFKTINNTGPLPMRLMVDYDDGATEVITGNSMEDGWHSVQLFSDSLRTPVRVYGVSRFDIPADNKVLYIDSITLVRSRVNPLLYSNRVRQRIYGNKEVRKNIFPSKQTNDEDRKSVV